MDIDIDMPIKIDTNEKVPVEVDYKREEELMILRYGRRYHPDGYGTGEIDVVEENW